MSDKKYVFAKGVQKSAMTVQEIQDIASLQKRLSELEEQAQALVSAATIVVKEAMGTIRTHEDAIRADSGNTNIQVVEIKYELFKQALEAYEAWKSNNVGGDEKA